MKAILEDIENLYKISKLNTNASPLMLNITKKLFQDILNHYNLKPINLLIKIKGDSNGAFSIYDNRIEINRKLLDFSSCNTQDEFNKKFVELLHTLFHEPRHYMQFLYFNGKLSSISSDDILSQLTEEEKIEYLKELKNPNNEIVFTYDKEMPIFYYSQFHEKDAVNFALTQLESIAYMIDDLDIKQTILDGVQTEKEKFDKQYKDIEEIVKDKGYSHKEININLEKTSIIELETDELLKRAIAEFLPINKCIIEEKVLISEGMDSKNFNYKNFYIKLSNNNNEWFITITKDNDEQICAKISNDNCCIYRMILYNDSDETLKTYKNLIEILKSIVNIYESKTNNQINNYIFTPNIILTETERENFMKKLIKQCGFIENEPNEIFLNVNYKKSSFHLINPLYKISVKSKLNEINVDTLDKKINSYRNINAALISSEQLSAKDENINR